MDITEPDIFGFTYAERRVNSFNGVEYQYCGLEGDAVVLARPVIGPARFTTYLPERWASFRLCGEISARSMK